MTFGILDWDKKASQVLSKQSQRGKSIYIRKTITVVKRYTAGIVASATLMQKTHSGVLEYDNVIPNDIAFLVSFYPFVARSKLREKQYDELIMSYYGT